MYICIYVYMYICIYVYMYIMEKTFSKPPISNYCWSSKHGDFMGLLLRFTSLSWLKYVGFIDVYGPYI